MSRAERLDRARGALLGTFTGDALGMPFEGQLPEAIPEQLEMEEARLGRGTYTDDTQMAIALAESLLERGKVDADHLAAAFADSHDPDRGYGEGTTTVLQLIRSGVPVSEAAAGLFDGRGSMGNGAAMRIAPVAVRFAHDPERLAQEAERSALVTHTHPFAVAAARAQAAAVGAALRGDDPLVAAFDAATTAELRHRLDGLAALLAGEGATVAVWGDTRRATETAPPPAWVGRTLGNGTAAQESVPTAIYSALAHDGFEQAVTFAVRCGGDTDTIAAMAGAIAGAREGASAIPARWLDALENGEKGREYVAGLAENLAEGGARRS